MKRTTLIELLPYFGKGYQAYEAAKRWIEINCPDISYSEREQLHRLAAKMAGI